MPPTPVATSKLVDELISRMSKRQAPNIQVDNVTMSRKPLQASPLWKKRLVYIGLSNSLLMCLVERRDVS